MLSGVGASIKGLVGKEAIVDEVKYDLGVMFTGEMLFKDSVDDSETADEIQVDV